MIKQPGKDVLSTWLEYHATEVGIERFYLRVEDTPSLRPLLENTLWRDRVSVDFVEDTVRDWTGVATRQAHHTREAIAAARRDGLTHLLAIDADELLFLPRGVAALHRDLGNLSGACSLHVRNMEALVPSMRCRNPFAEARAFRHRPWEYGAYGYPPSSGKSIGVLAVDDLTTNGPHHFGREHLTPEMDGTPLAGGGSLALPHGTAVVLHYESCTYLGWRNKFEQLARAPNGADKARQFSPFYSASVDCCAALEHAKAAVELAGAAVADAEMETLRVAKQQAHAVWQHWRVAPSGLPPPPSPDTGVSSTETSIRVLQRRGITLIDPPPAAAAAARAHSAASAGRLANRIATVEAAASTSVASADWLHSASRPSVAECWERFAPEAVRYAAANEVLKLTHCSGGGCTHWIDCQSAPRCALEALALTVVGFHLRRLGGDAFLRGRSAGAEWWVHRLDPEDSLSVHWDCDENLKSATGEHTPPFIATVTYLTDVGAPTIVLPIAADARGRGFRHGAEADPSSCGMAEPVRGARAVATSSLDAFASFPVAGKHLSFDGRLLHGAVYDGPEVEQSAVDGRTSPKSVAEADRQRMTVLVNLWVGVQPTGIPRLPDELLEALREAAPLDAGAGALTLPVGDDVASAPPHRLKPSDDGEWREFRIGSFHHPPVKVRGLGSGFVRPPAPSPIHFVSVGVDVDAGTADEATPCV